MPTLRIGMIVPSLNTIAEDDFRRFCPSEVAYHVHRIRLRKEPGRVTMEDLVRSYLEAGDSGRLVADMMPAAIAFNCTGASVAYGKLADRTLAEQMTRALGVPTTNTMVAIKQALDALHIKSLVHVSPFADEFAEIERASMEESGFRVVKSVGLGFTDAKLAAQMPPEQIMSVAVSHNSPDADGLLLSCANVRAFEAVEAVEERLGKPVVTSNQAMLWGVLRLAGWKGRIEGAGLLLRQ